MNQYPFDPEEFQSAPLLPGPRWHVGREVSITLIASVMIQTCAFIWYVSKLDSRVHVLETARAEQIDALTRIVDDRDGTHVRLTALEVKVESILDGIRRIEAHLYGNATPHP